MTVFVFTGPTLAAPDAHRELDAVVLPPVAQGDVYRAVLRRPTAIGIVDGYFERVPAVWHKEILWALKEGVHVYGSASMGALRAAELHVFGMVGVGEIYEAFRDGVLEDDDEVAVAHAGDDRYASFSEAMVNIRATLRAAVDAGVVGAATAEALTGLAKHLFYSERSYPVLLRLGAANALPPTELRALADWLPGGRRDQKREDALAMLRLMRERRDADVVPNRVRFSFEHTDMWEVVRGEAGRLYGTNAETVLEDEVLDELRLRGNGSYARTRDAVMVRLLAIEESRRLHLTVPPEVLQNAGVAFRQARHLLEPDAVPAWCAEQQITVDDWWRLVEDEVRLRWVRDVTNSEVREQLADELRLAGTYSALLERARRKRALLERLGLAHPALSALALPEHEVLRWYFGERLGMEYVPKVATWAADQGFASEDAFRRALAREFCFANVEEHDRAGL